MLMPLVFIILTREAGPKRLGRLMAVLGIPMLLGPMGGPILSGWLIESFGWAWIFLINIPIGALAFTLAAVVFKKDKVAPSETFDFIGMLLLSPGLALFLFGGSSLPAHGTVTSRAVWMPASVGLLLIIGFVFHALFRADHPLIDLLTVQEPDGRTGERDDVFARDRVLRCRVAVPQLLSAVARPDAAAVGCALIPRGPWRDADDGRSLAGSWTSADRVGSC